VEFTEQHGDLAGVPPAYFLLAFVHTWRGDLAEAQDWYERVLAVSRRIGDLTMEVRALTYLAVVARRHGEPEAASGLAGDALELATAGGMPEYVGIAYGNLAWAAWRKREVEQAELDAEASWAALQKAAAVPFFWIGLWPLLVVRLAQADVSGCVGLAGRLLEPEQMKLPDELEEPLAGAVKTWEAGDAAAAGDLLHTAVARAEESGWGWL
jgi:tetratricopeptide (TPR) repeat protein